MIARPFRSTALASLRTRRGISRTKELVQIFRNRINRDFALPLLATEYRFHPTRKWRFDIAFVHDKLAIEIDGGIWTGGRHTRGTGWLADACKLNNGAILGWRVLRFTPDQLLTPEAMEMVRAALGLDK